MKIAVVVGSSSNLIEEYIIQISKHFSTLKEIWVITEDIEKLKETKKIIYNKKVILIQLNLNLDESYEQYKLLLTKNKARIKILVNCFDYNKIIDFDKSSYNEQMNILDLNCKPIIAITKLSIPHMYSTSYITNVVSSLAFMSLPKLAVYSSTQSFILKFSKILSKELKSKGIKVTTVCFTPTTREIFDILKLKINYYIFKIIPQTKIDKFVKLSLKATIKGKQLKVDNILFKVFIKLLNIIPNKLM